MLYIFDLDGTLRITKSGRPCPNELGDQELLPNVKDKMIELRDDGHILTAASNQCGVELGFMTAYRAERIAAETDSMIGDGGVLSSIKFCFRRDDRSCKPRPDMLLSLIRDFNLAQAQTVMIGNEYTDQQAAHNAGVGFIWAHDFFGWDNIVENQNGFFPGYWYEKWRARKNAAEKG